MPQFDVFRAPDGTFLLDCQPDALGYLTTRLMAPLLPLEQAPPPRGRLNPIFEIDDAPHVMVTQFAAAIGAKELRARFTNLATHSFDIVGAFDMLLTGV